MRQRSDAGLDSQTERALSGHRFRSADADGDGRSDLFATAGPQVVVYLGADIDPETLALPRQPSRAWPALLAS